MDTYKHTQHNSWSFLIQFGVEFRRPNPQMKQCIMQTQVQIQEVVCQQRQVEHF